ncbi:MAG: helix-turn-helix domain-containing protein [Eubacterium sp.]|nr:helix-turn-helix domain-containing protein [Eubacterium sp.]
MSKQSRENIINILMRASTAKSLQELADLGYELLSNPIFIEDRSAFKLAYSQNCVVDDPHWNADMGKSRTVLPDRNHVEEMLVGYRESSRTGLPIIVQDDYMPQKRLVKTIYVDGSHVGTIVATGYFEEFTDEDIELMEILSGYIIRFLDERGFPLSEDTMAVENMLFRLLQGAHFPDNVVEERLIKGLHAEKGDAFFAFDIFPRTQQGKDGIIVHRIMEDLRRAGHCTCFFFNMHIVCIIKATEDNPIDAPDEFAFTPILESEELIAGISQPFTDLNFLLHYYNQALAMAQLADVLGNKERVYFSYDTFASYHMMELAGKDRDLSQFCHHKILMLEKYDYEHNTEFTKTLHVYLESSRSISHTAEVLFLHKNTVTYRINKCFEILSTKIEDNNELFAFLFSLRILEYRKKKIMAMSAPYIKADKDMKA